MKQKYIPIYIRNEDARNELYNRISNVKRDLFENKLTIVGICIISLLVMCAIFAPYLAPYPEDAGQNLNYGQQSEPPSIQHPMGTDVSGRDILSRALFGARISLLMGFVIVGLSAGIGVPIGLYAGYTGGVLNAIIMRTSDVFIAVPPTLLALAVIAILEPNLWTTMAAISIAWWPWYARLTQGEVLSLKEREFIEVSEALGAGHFHIMFKEILPNLASVLSVKMTLDMGFAILVGAGLAFLGLGAQPPTPSWGVMIAQGRNYVTDYWWMATFPGIMISFTVLGFNLLGDGIRDVLDEEVR